MNTATKISDRIVHIPELDLTETRILIIDNDSSTRFLINDYLLQKNYTYIHSVSWKESAEAYDKFDPNIILAGIIYPHNEGMEILKSFMSSDYKKEIIIFTNHKELKLSLEALRMGVCDIITNPICPEDLENALSKAKKRLSLKKNQEDFIHRIDNVLKEKSQLFIDSDNDFISRRMMQGTIHNLNGPLSAISGNAQLLEMGVEDLLMFLSKNREDFHPTILSELMKKITRYNEFLTNMSESCERMKDIISGFLSKWRKDNATKAESININDFLELELKYLNSNMIFKNQIKKHYDFGQNLPPLEGIYSDFSQTFHNLIDNAIDSMHNHSKKELKIVSRADDAYIYIEIHDTGCGIEEENIQKIFQPFFSTKPSASINDNEPIGTGLGLSNCVDLMKPYGVTFDVKSKPGSGTCIIWKIPTNKSSGI